MACLNNSTDKQKGLAALELTIILPFLLLLLFATVEYSRLLYQYNTLNKTVRDAARYVMAVARPSENKNIIDISEQHAKNVNLLLSSGSFSGTEQLLPQLSANNEDITGATNNFTIEEKIDSKLIYQLQISVVDDFITLQVTYYWQPLFSGYLTSVGLNLNYPLVATYTVRV